MIKYHFLFISIIFLVFLSGCITSIQRVEFYPNYQKRIQTAEKVHFFMDLSEIKDIPGDINRVCSQRDKELRESLANEALSVLKKKGYNVIAQTFTSGAFRSVQAPYLMFKTYDDMENEIKSTVYPPFVMDADIEKKLGSSAILENLYQKLARTSKRGKNLPNSYYKDAKHLKKLSKSDVAVVLLVDGFKTDAMKELTNAIFAAFFLGTYEKSYAIAGLYILSLDSGELIWDNAEHAIYDTTTDSDYHKIVENLFDELPAKNVTLASK